MKFGSTASDLQTRKEHKLEIDLSLICYIRVITKNIPLDKRRTPTYLNCNLLRKTFYKMKVAS